MQDTNNQIIVVVIQVTYLQQEPIEPSVAHDELRQFLEPNYYASKLDSNEASEFFAFATSRKIIVLAGISFANKILPHFVQSTKGTSSQSSNGRYSFLIGDLWGDTRRKNSVIEKLRLLTDRGHDVYGLRNAVNGTDKLADSMRSIEFNSSRFHRNPFIQRFWEQTFSCSVANDDCDRNKRLQFPVFPILRNYKAPLVIDAALVLRQYVLDYRKQHNEPPSEFFDHDFYGFHDGNILETWNNWTGNGWLLGIPFGNENMFDWIQPLEWKYEIVKLVSDNTMLAGDLYGTWWIEKYLKDNFTSVLSLTSSSARLPVVPQCVSEETDSLSCNSTDLHSMVALVATVALLLLLCCGVWIYQRRENMQQVKRVITSPGLLIISCTVFVSIVTSMWIIMGDDVLDCDNRVDDFLVTLTISVFFAVLLVHLLVQLTSSHLMKLVIKWFGFLIIVAVAVVVSAVAHLDQTEEIDDDSNIVNHCYKERRKTVSVVSYLYGTILCITCITLLLRNICSKNGDYIESNLTFKTVAAFLAIFIGVVYTVLVIVLVWIDSHDSCVIMGRIFIVLACFPMIVCLINIVVLLLSEPSNAVDAFHMKSPDMECMSTTHNFYCIPNVLFL